MSFPRTIVASPALLALLVFVMSACADEFPAVVPTAERTLAEAGRSRVIAFRLAAPAPAERTFPATASDPEVLELLLPPAVLAGESIGFLRVRGKREGETRLEFGGASLVVRVIAPRVPDAERARPRIVVPAPGACVWGGFSVGVEVDEDFASRVELRRSGGKALAPRADGGPALGPTRRLRFDLAPEDVSPGPLVLRAVTIQPGGGEVAGEPVELLAIAPADDLLVLEAEDQRDAPRPERFGTDKFPVGVDPEASGQQYAGNWGSDPAVCFPVTIPETGEYQVFVIARGDPAGGALPTVALIVDGADEPRTNSPLADRTWHRIPLGVPVTLEAGARTLTPYFVNDFWVESLADRNLYLDRLELARVRRVGTAPAPGGGMTMGSEMSLGMRGGGAGSAVRIAIAPPLDGRMALGPLEVQGACAWPDMENSPAPWVTLLLNGKPLSRQRSAAPRFWIEGAAFAPGLNIVQLSAELDSGGRGASAEHVLECLKPGAPAQDCDFRRFTIRDPAWDPSIRERFSGDRDPPEHVSAGFWANGEASLTLPDGLAGTYEVFVEGRGDDFEGPARCTVSLHVGESSTPVGEVDMPGWWEAVHLGSVTLSAGPKRMVFAFANDKFAPDQGDRNLWLQSAILVRARPGADETPPSVQVAWPPAGHPVWQADVVIAEAWEDRLIAWAELLVDGASSGIRLYPALKSGPLVFPLILRTLAAGDHTLAVRVADAVGHMGDSVARPFTVSGVAPETPGRYARAVRLLSRFAYGPDPQELAAVLRMGEEAWLEDRLARGGEDPGDADALAHGLALFRSRDGDYDVAGRVVQHVTQTANPVRARFVQWVENHFSTWIRKAGAEPEWREHEAFLRLGIAPFPDLLAASSRSPAMLFYLDQQVSFAGRLNENYAREIMELHSLGVNGGYTQADVTTLAALLTGWTFSDEGDGFGPGYPRRKTFRFDPALNDGAARRFLGMACAKAAPDQRYDRARSALELLAAHPSTARFVCRKLAEHYVVLPAPAALVDDLARVFRETHGDLRAVLCAIARHPAFWDRRAPDKVCSPFEFAVRLTRACRIPNPWGVIEFLQRSGMGVFDRPTPDGWSEEDVAWTDTNAMLQRWRFVRAFAWGLADVVPPEWRWSQEGWTDAQRQALVDVLAVRLLGRPLSEASNRAALEVLAKATGSRDEVVQFCASFVAQLPEANLR